MLIRHRGMLTLLTLVVLAGVLVTASGWLVTARVEPATASRGQIMRYLVLADLRTESPETQVAWVDRLQQELSGDFTTAGGDAATQLSDGYRQRLANNIGTLQEVWFQTRTTQYARLPEEQREAFMVEQLALVGAWAKVASLLSDKPVPPEVATKGLIAQIEKWVQQASGEQRDEMVAAVKDGTLCWLSMTDLQTQPLPVKQELAQRFARELDRGAQPKVAGLVTDDERRARLAHNAGQLVEAYIYTLAEQFANLEPAQRTEFIDEQLAAVQRWGVAQLLAGESTNESSQRASAALALVQQSQQWIEHAPEAKRDDVRALVGAVQQRIVWQQLPAWLRQR